MEDQCAGVGNWLQILVIDSWTIKFRSGLIPSRATALRTERVGTRRLYNAELASASTLPDVMMSFSIQLATSINDGPSPGEEMVASKCRASGESGGRSLANAIAFARRSLSSATVFVPSMNTLFGWHFYYQ